MAYFRCTSGGSGKGNTVVVTCDSDFAGQTITLATTGKSYSKTCPSTSPYTVTFYGIEAGTYTVSATVGGETYSETVIVQDISAVLNYGFKWQTWVDASVDLDSSDYSSLADVLADEEAVRELFTVHDCVDYLASMTVVDTNVETVLNDDICAKWINLRDYALDTLYANEVLANVMDEADKYFYGEWALVGQVPTMTSNTAPYGEVFANGTLGSGYDAYKAFDGANDSSGWAVNGDGSNVGYIGYHFPTPQRISKVYMANRNEATPRAIKKFKIQGSNTGNTNDYHDISVELTNPSSSQAVSNTYDISATSTEAYSYIRLFITDVYDTSYYGIGELQFYSWAPKGNVPVMTSNTAPYGEAIKSTEYSSTYAAYNAFNESAYGWTPATSDTLGNCYVGYKFVNPICVKKMLMDTPTGSTTRVSAFKLQGSNDATNWTDLLTVTDKVNGIDYYEVDNDDYYLYLRILVTAGATIASTAILIRTLQFYGRELSVSVPKMATNTTPYGECICSTSLGAGNEAYRSFVGNPLSAWLPSSGATNNRIGYIFTAPKVVKKVHLTVSASNNDHGSANMQIQGYDGINWETLETFTITQATANKVYDIDLNNNTPYEAYCLFTEDMIYKGSATTVIKQMADIQFYGLDYSEKEFEEGTTKKWLYDHGVELEELTFGVVGTNASYTKNSNDVLLSKGATNGASAYMVTSNTIDLTDYDLLRMKAGDILLTSTCGCITVGDSYSTVDAYSDIILGNNPNTYSLSVSSFNQSKKITARNTINGPDAQKMTVKELWLE